MSYLSAWEISGSIMIHFSKNLLQLSLKHIPTTTNGRPHSQEAKWPRWSIQRIFDPMFSRQNFDLEGVVKKPMPCLLGHTKLYNLHQISFVTTRMTSLNITLAKDHLLYKGWEKNWNAKRHISTPDVLIETWRVAPNRSLVRVVTIAPPAPNRSLPFAPASHKRQATNPIALHMKLLHPSLVSRWN